MTEIKSNLNTIYQALNMWWDSCLPLQPSILQTLGVTPPLPPPNTLCKSALYTLLSSHTPLLSVPWKGLLALGLGACYYCAGNPLCPAPQVDSSILPWSPGMLPGHLARLPAQHSLPCIVVLFCLLTSCVPTEYKLRKCRAHALLVHHCMLTAWCTTCPW